MTARGIRIGIVIAALVLTPCAQAREGFLKHLDTLMRNYADSFHADGSPGDIAQKFLFGGKYGLKSIDAAMKGYADAQQKVGEQAMTDLKVVLKDLLDIRTYLPGPIGAAWDALVGELGVLKARFLARVENPWADGPAASATAMGRASSIRVATSLDDAGMRGAFDDFVNARKTAQKALALTNGLDAGVRGKAETALVAQAHEMEDRLLERLSTSDRGMSRLESYVGGMDPKTARGCFSRLTSRLTRNLADAALRSSDEPTKLRAQRAQSLRRRVTGSR